MSPTVVGRKVGNIGYGLLGESAPLVFLSNDSKLTPREGFTLRPTLPPDEQAFAAMHAALDSGCNLWNGGTFYGPPDNNSLVLLNKYYSEYPEDADKVVLNIKGAMRGMTPDGSREYLRQDVENALKQLGGKGKIDMYECARRDPNTPLKITLETLAELVKEGKIGGVALSEVNADTIKEAASITKIVAVEVELSLWSTEPLTNGITKVCGELGIPIIA